MPAFFALIRKDVRLFLMDRRALLISLALPIVIGAFFGYLFGGNSDKKGAIDVVLVQQDDSAAGAKVAAGLRAEASLHVTPMTLAAARQAVARGKQQVAIVIPAGFGKAAGAALFGAGPKPQVDLLYDPSQSAILAMVKGMLTQQVMQAVSADMFGGKSGTELTERAIRQIDSRAAQDSNSAALRDLLAGVQKYQTRQQAAGGTSTARPGSGLAMPFSTHEEGLSAAPARQGFNPYAHSFAGMGVQFILLMGVDMGISILLAQRSGIWQRLLAAPISLTTVLMARAASGALIALALLAVIFAVAAAGFGVHIASLAGFAGVAVAFALVTASFGLLIAAFGKTPEAARGLAVFATLIMVMLGGAWVPSFMFPAWVQQAAVVVPTRWAIEGIDAVTWRGMALADVAPTIAALLGFALLFGSVAMWRLRRAAS